MKNLNHSFKHVVIHSFLTAKEIGSLRFNNNPYRLPLKGFKFNLNNKVSLHLKHNMVIEMLKKMFLVWRWGWLRKKDIKMWLTHYTLLPSFFLTTPGKAPILKNPCFFWRKCPLVPHTSLDVQSSPCVGGPHSTQQPCLGPGDEGAVQPFHWYFSSLWISFNCSICRQFGNQICLS